ncbi:MAG: VTT domain-containing protein [Defluviitaleaceae bacterium]|nr:VTT domain-containing protein [Defluviitaleaceae bacterium]
MIVIHFILHINEYIASFIDSYGALTYLILFLVIFCETGLVFLPFLPGDSLIFAAATFSTAAYASTGHLNYWWLYGMFIVAAVVGDNVNYLIGRELGERIVKSQKIKFLNEKNLNKAYTFIEKHGSKAVFLARFMPIIRTIVPFVIGAGEMNWKKFTVYNLVGGVVWVTLFINLGYFFGNMVGDHFSLVMLGIIFLSLIPIVIEVIGNIVKKMRKVRG